jgi:glycosyltransferase involved in cell wall biosynthesis
MVAKSSDLSPYAEKDTGNPSDPLVRAAPSGPPTERSRRDEAAAGPGTPPLLSIVIPASNEGAYIGACLASLLGSEDPGGPVEVLVVANGCHDDTAEAARALAPRFMERGWRLEVLELAEGDKIAALNTGEATASGTTRVFLDADIAVSPALLRQLAAALDRDGPVYASGRLTIPRPRSFISARYAGFWEKLPFIQDGVPGCGLFAVNAAARSRWDQFPRIISDDTFVRYQFRDDEMVAVDAPYSWPITEGFGNLVRVRRRQDQGIAEIRQLHPDLARSASSTAPGAGRLLRLLLRDPVGFAIYAAVAFSVRLPIYRNRSSWDRGR